MTRVELANDWLEDYRRRVDDRTLAMARAYVERGLSYSEIAKEHGLSRQRVGQLLGPLGLASDRRPLKQAAREQALRAAYERIMAKESTLDAEALGLGYKNGPSLRFALSGIGLRVTLGHKPPAHGTYARYTSRRYPCKCDECRRANRERMKAMKEREPPEHGTPSAYMNYGCRCQACKEAHRRHQRARRAEKRQLVASQD